MSVTFTDIFKIIFAFLLPPLGVFLEIGLKGAFWLNILLTLLGASSRRCPCPLVHFSI